MRCGRCREIKSVIEFSPSYVTAGRGTCRPCVKASGPRQSAARAAWHAANKDRINAAAKERYAQDPEKHRALGLEYYYRVKPANADIWNRKSHFGSIRRKFNMSPEEYEARIAAQGGGCAICDAKQSDAGHRLAVDHDHVTGKVRGILCRKCNTGLGCFGDSADGVQKALSYLTQIPDSSKPSIG